MCSALKAHDTRAERLRFADDGAEALGLRCMQKHVGRADPRDGIVPAHRSDEAHIHPGRVRQPLERAALRAVPHDDERPPFVPRTHRDERDGAVEALARDEAAHANGDARPGEGPASLGRRRPHVGQLDRRGANARDPLDGGARSPIERRG